MIEFVPDVVRIEGDNTLLINGAPSMNDGAKLKARSD